MQTSLRVLRVFLASPDDLKPERVAAESLVNEINKYLNEAMGWHIYLYKWEDAVPGYGRAQAIINEAVDDCMLFVGLLWEKWGQPTGDYSSGFEEEFERALARRKKAEEPEIWLVFKAPNPEKAKDPGPELSKVLEFRRQRATQEVLYREVADLDEWKTKLQSWLWDNVVRRASAAALPSQPQRPAPVSALDPSDASADGVGASEQLQGVAASLRRVIKSGELEFGRQEAKLMSEFDVARLFLLANTWMSRRYTNGTVGTHELNILYKYRKKLDATATESLQIFRSILVDTGEVTPGWFWFNGMAVEGVEDQLAALAIFDTDEDVKRQALSLLREAKIRLPPSLWSELVPAERTAAQNEAYRYLASIADEAVLSFLEHVISVEPADSPSEARHTRIEVLLRLRPQEAFKELIRTGLYIADDTIAELRTIADALDDEALVKGAESEWEQLRGFSAEELSRRKRLPDHLLQKLIGDSSVGVREIAYRELARQGQKLDFTKLRESLSAKEEPGQGQPSYLIGLLGGGVGKTSIDVDAVILTAYQHQDVNDVLAAVDWFAADGHLAYRSLATDHYPIIEGDLRQDIKDNFVRVKESSMKAMESKWGEAFAERVAKQFEHLNDFILSQFLEAGLAGIAANGCPSDVQFGREYLANERYAVKLLAARIIGKFGTPEDALALLETSNESWGELRDEAGIAALRLSLDPFQVAIGLTQSKSPALVRAAYEWLYMQNSSEADKFFGGLIESESTISRVRSLYYFFKHRTESELALMLEAQLDKDAYYYNVVTWLDRVLYSPAPLREHFILQLKTSASQ